MNNKKNKIDKKERSCALFGPGGNSDSFYEQGNKRTAEAPAWLHNIGLDAYEYQGGNGIRARAETLRLIGEQATEYGISMSLHAPYFISLSGVETEKRLKSIMYIKQSLDAAELIGADTIVIHTGSAAKIERSEALNLAKDTLYRTLEEIPDTGVKLGLETMGKKNQLGTLEEVLDLCRLDSRLVPVIDFGHLRARSLGEEFSSADDFERLFEQIANSLDEKTAKNVHCHFSRIEWTGAGERRHLTFEDTQYGPDFEPLIEVVAKHRLTPRIICESAGTMASDALMMKEYYQSLV